MTTRCEYEMASDNLTMMDIMLRKEQTIYAQNDFFNRSLPIAPVTVTPDSSGNCDLPVDPLCRKTMAKWVVGLCNYCSYDSRMVASIMSCVDRFVATPKGSRMLLNRDKYQVVVMASLYLVAKIQPIHTLEPESIAKLSRGKYTKFDIEVMELEILTSLKWFVNPPTPMLFADEFLKHFDFVPEDDSVFESENDESSSASSKSSSSSTSTTEERLIELIKYQIEESIYDYELSCLTRPSHVTFGAFSNALQSLNIDSSDLDSMRILKERLQITDDDDDVSVALLRAISSSESSNKSLSSLLLDRSSGHYCSNKARRSKRNSHEAEHKTAAPSCTTRTSSSSNTSVTSSPRTVAEGILLNSHLNNYVYRGIV
jgi:hypothetical protein